VWRAGMEDADDFDADLKHVDWSGDALMFFWLQLRIAIAADSKREWTYNFTGTISTWINKVTIIINWMIIQNQSA
jgi:hypothetical protein